MSIELWKELIELDGHISSTNPGLYGRLIRGLPRTKSQKLQEEIGWFLPDEVIDLYAWKNGVYVNNDVEEEEEKCTQWELKPGGVLIPLQTALRNLVNDSLFDHMKNLYVEYGYLRPDEEIGFAPLFVNSDWQWRRDLDYVLLAPLTRRQRDTLPLVNFDSGADAGLPYLCYDSLLTMVQGLNWMHRAQMLRVTPIGHLYIEGVQIVAASEIYYQLNPQCDAITICENEKHYGESR